MVVDRTAGTPRFAEFQQAPESSAATGASESATDAAILLRIAAGDQTALAECYDRFARAVYSLARRICGQHTSAEDVSQDVFLTAWRSAGRFDPARGSATNWLLTLTHHKAVDAVRREATARRHAELAGDGWALPTGPGAVKSRTFAAMAQLRARLEPLAEDR